MDIISAREAFESGLTRYFTGAPCKYGHIAARMISNGSCVDCLKIRTTERRRKNPSENYENVKRWRAANKDKVAAQEKRYAAKHPETRAKAKAKYREANIDLIRTRDKELKARMRATDPEGEKRRRARFEARREAEKSALAGRQRPEICDICAENKIGRIVFDHCHASNLFRGWLCDRCNKTLGMVKDDPALLDNLKSYLEKFNDSLNHEKAQ